jgi:ribosome-binding factor A
MQIGDQVRAELATIIQRDISDNDIKFVTFTEVEISTDIRVAKIFVSVLGSADDQKSTMKALERHKNKIRFLIGQRLKLRVTPELHFVQDSTAENAVKMGKLIDEAVKDIKPDESE